MTWYDGGLTPPKPVEIGDEELNKGGGVLFIGTKGKLHARHLRLQSAAAAEVAARQRAASRRRTYARIQTSHEMNWIDAIRGTQKTSSPFEYSAKLTEIMLLGVVVAQRRQEDPLRRREHEDHQQAPRKGPDFNDYLTREYRTGW